MTHNCIALPKQLTLDLAVEQYLMPNPRRCYIVSGPRVVGLLTHRIGQVPRDKWPETQIGTVAVPLSD